MEPEFEKILHTPEEYAQQWSLLDGMLKKITYDKVIEQLNIVQEDVSQGEAVLTSQKASLLPRKRKAQTLQVEEDNGSQMIIRRKRTATSNVKPKKVLLIGIQLISLGG